MESIELAGDKFGVETVNGLKYVLGIVVTEHKFEDGKITKIERVHPDPSLLPEGFEAVMVNGTAVIRANVASATGEATAASGEG